MDYEALAYFVLISFVSLSILTVSIGVTVRLFLAPVLSDIAERFASRPSRDDRELAAGLDRLDDRLAALESGMDRIEAAQDFDRRLASVDPPKSETA